MYPTILYRKACFPQGRLHLSEGLIADAIRRWYICCYFLKPPFTVRTSNNHLPGGDDFYAYEAI